MNLHSLITVLKCSANFDVFVSTDLMFVSLNNRNCKYRTRAWFSPLQYSLFYYPDCLQQSYSNICVINLSYRKKWHVTEFVRVLKSNFLTLFVLKQCKNKVSIYISTGKPNILTTSKLEFLEGQNITIDVGKIIF